MSVDKLKESCIVVGAGIAGLCSAHVLQDSGMPVVVLDQGRTVGGRLATRVSETGFLRETQLIDALIESYQAVKGNLTTR